MFLSCKIRVSEWIHTLQLPECQGTPCSKLFAISSHRQFSGKKLQLINFFFRLKFLGYWRRRSFQRIVRRVGRCWTIQTSKTKSKCHRKRYMLFSCGLFVFFVFCLCTFWLSKCQQNGILYLKLLGIPFFFINFEEVQISPDSQSRTHFSSLKKAVLYKKVNWLQNLTETFLNGFGYSKEKEA